jgi:hypothetical protein
MVRILSSPLKLPSKVPLPSALRRRTASSNQIFLGAKVETHRVLKAIMHDHHVIIRNNGNVIASVHPQNFNVKHQFEFKVGGKKRASYKRFRSLHHYPKQNKISSKLLRYKDTLDHVQSAINLNGGYTSHNSFTIHTFKT